MDNIQFVIFVVVCLSMLIGAAKFLQYAHKDEQVACVAAGYTWSPTKYVCVIKT